MFGHLGVDPAAAHFGIRHYERRWAGKPVPRLHDLHWLPRREARVRLRW
jgi:hypothetical protein